MFGSRRDRATKDLAASAFGAAAGPWAITGPDGVVVAAGAAYADLAGVGAPGEAPPVAKLFADADWEAGVARLVAAATSGGASRELAAPAKSGAGGRLYRVDVEPVAKAHDHLFWRLADVTERDRADAALRDEVRRLADLLDGAPVGFYSVDAHGRFIYVNDTLARRLGRRAAELVAEGLGPRDFLADGTLAEDAEALLAGCDAEGEAEVRFRGVDGSVWSATLSQTASSPGTGHPACSRTVVHEQGAEAERRGAFSETGPRLRGLFDRAPMGIAVLDLDGIVIETNPAFARMVEDPGQGLEGRILGELLAFEDRDEVGRELAALLRGAGRAAPIEVRPERGDDRVLLLYLGRLEEDDGTVSGLVAHLIDSTEQKKLELRFAQAQKMQAVGQLAGGIAHDFNNILTAILGFCDLLLMRHQAGDQSFSDIMQVKQNANRATNLVRQLLAFSRQQTLTPKVLALTDALAELASLLRRLIGENIEFELIHERDLWLVKVDQGPFEQTIINLAVNARDAMKGGGKLTIRTHNVHGREWTGPSREMLPDGDYVLIEVRDTGEGIPLEIQSKIFEPFFTTKDVGAGTGLGLSTVYGIVRQFNGYIFVDSRPGEGAAFYIFLPRHQPAEEADGDAANAAPGEARGEPVAAVAPFPDDEEEGAVPRDLTGKGTVLLVEDEEAVRLFGARALRNKGYTVLEADCGDSALELLGSYDELIDVLVTDVVMPRMDGPELMARVRQSNPDIKVIFISGYTEDIFRGELEIDATINFLPKPFSIRQLASKVKEVLAADSP